MSLVILALAITGAGWFIGEGIRDSSAAQVQAQQQATRTLVGAAAIQSSNNAVLAAQQAQATAQQQMVEQEQQQLLNQSHPDGLEQLTAANQAAWAASHH